MPDIKKTNLNKSISVKPQVFNSSLGLGDISASAKNAEKARIWAEGTDEEVETLGGEHSAKGWAEEASGGGGAWGDITGNISDQTDLQNALNLKMDKSGGTFTGDIMLSSGISLKTTNGKLHEVNNKLVLGDSSNNGLYINPNGQTAALINGNTVKNIITSSDITSTYSATGLDPVNGTAVASAISTKQDTLPSGTTGNYLQKTSSGVTWAAVDALPSQAGQSGKYLTTNGTTASWGTVQSGANTSLSNITDAGKIVIAHNAMPSLTYDELTPTNEQTYTAPADGYFYLLGISNSTSAYIEMYDTSNNEEETDTVRLTEAFVRSSPTTLPFWCPVFKGQKVVLLYKYISFSYTGFTNLGMKFFYAVGSTSEQQQGA